MFFHSLIMDNKKAFDGDSDEKGYNQVMTTKSEFLKILDQMYERGYVLVRMRDIAYETTDENGNSKFVAGDIMLPPGKKPFVMSQDDVCYYDYMKGDGFATRIVIGDDGKPTCEMELDDGTVVTGSFDLVPLLEDFIAEHPDFSYKGARAVLAFTGYQGVLGYRTDPEYKDSNPNYEEDLESVRQVAQCLRDGGWELASHSWGHINLGSRDLASVKTDTDKWEERVDPSSAPPISSSTPSAQMWATGGPIPGKTRNLPICTTRASAISAMWIPAPPGYSWGLITCARDGGTWTATACTTIFRKQILPRII